MSFASNVLPFLKSLKIEGRLPKAISVLDPYTDPYTFSLCEKFYHQYYNDERPRTVILGINPGRFGSGTTGISFTDPVLLDTQCGIKNTLVKKGELSADFIYRMITDAGGPSQFYSRFFISAVSPLGFMMDGKNINYYDDKKLEKAVTPFIISSITSMLEFPLERKVCYCIGEDKNLKFLTTLNTKHQWFEKIVGLPHPRFIMQYKRRQLQHYIDLYLERLEI